MNWSIVRRYATKPFRKTFKILQHFEEKHKYDLSHDTKILRRTIEDGLRSSTSLTKLDQKLCTSLPNLTTEGVLSLLNSWGTVKPDTLSSTIFYKAFLKNIQKGLWKSAPWNQLVQIMYFVGYEEQDSKQMMILFLHRVNESPMLATAHFKDVCIISETAFRTLTGISSTGIRTRVRQILETNSQELIADSIWLVMLIKMMVFSKYLDAEVVKNLGDVWAKDSEIQRMPFTAKSYVLSLFAHAGVKHEQLFNLLMESVSKTIRQKDCRVKDMSMFLWAVSFFDFQVNRVFLENVLNFLESEMKGRNLRDGLGFVLKCCVSYWMLDRAPRVILDQMVTLESLKILIEKKKKFRDLSRLMLLIEIMESEPPRYLTPQQSSVKAELKKKSLLVPNIEKEIAKRPDLKKLVNFLISCGFINVRLNYPVRIYIAGVTAELNNTVIHVDLMDPTVCIESTPNGKLLSKTRLLKSQYPYIRHIYITPDHVNKNISKENWLELFGLARTKI